MELQKSIGKLWLVLTFLIVLLVTAAAASAATVVITPGSPDSSDTLTCSVNGISSDLNYYWYRNGGGTPIKTQTGIVSTLSSASTSGGDTISCEAFIPSVPFPYVPPQYIGEDSVTIAPDVPLNTPPVLNMLPNRVVDEDSGFHNNLVDLFSYASDAESSDSALTFSITEQLHTDVINCVIDSDRYIDCTTQPNAHDAIHMTVRVTDPLGEYAEREFYVEVVSINDAPTLSIANVAIDEDSGVNANLVNLVAATSDVDFAPPASHSYTITAETNPALVDCEVTGDFVSCTTGTPDAFGVSDVTVRVTDFDPTDPLTVHYVTDTFKVIVNSVNDVPEWGILPDQTLAQDSGLNANLINLHAFVADVETASSALAYDIIAETNTAVVDCTIIANQFFECTTQPGQSGFSDIAIRASDGSDVDTTGLRVTVTPTPLAACEDGVDNDGDGLVDFPADPGCASATDNDEFNAANVAPSITISGSPLLVTVGNSVTIDTVGEDVDGIVTNYVLDWDTLAPTTTVTVNAATFSNAHTEVANTVGTFSISAVVTDDDGETGTSNTVVVTVVPALPQCDDGIDNDGDGFTDFPAEPGCSSASDDDESDDPQCADGIDNDGDGLVDLADAGCVDLFDDDEFNVANDVPTVDLTVLPNLMYVTQILTLSSTMVDTDGEIDFYEIDWDGLFTNELVDTNAGSVNALRIRTVNTPGVFTITVTATDDEGASASQSEVVEVLAGPVPECSDGFDNDGDGLFDLVDPDCVDMHDDDESGSALSQCEDGVDNDGDGLIDFPADPDCTSLNDNDESSLPIPACADGTDNDGDGLIDLADPACSSIFDDDESDDPACNDGIDNDGDGFTDLADVGCTSVFDDDEVDPLVQCNDGIDNDGDGFTDFPADPGCSGPLDDDELNFVAQCEDGIDNDGDGLVDFPADPDCISAGDDDESSPPQPACSDGIDNDGDGLVDLADPACADANDTDESDDPACNDGIDNDGDGFTDLADAGCTDVFDTDETDPVVVPECSDGIDNDGDGFTDFPHDPACSSAGDINEFDNPECSDGIDNDADGFTDLADAGCSDIFDDDEFNVVVIPACSDGVDNDGDGLIDTADPGCVDSNDNDETDPVSTPECSDGIDNDSDGLIDLADPACSSAGDDDEGNDPECSDGIDNDSDGDIDFPDDAGCSSATDDDEFNSVTSTSNNNDDDDDNDDNEDNLLEKVELRYVDLVNDNILSSKWCIEDETVDALKLGKNVRRDATGCIVENGKTDVFRVVLRMFNTEHAIIEDAVMNVAIPAIEEFKSTERFDIKGRSTTQQELIFELPENMEAGFYQVRIEVVSEKDSSTRRVIYREIEVSRPTVQRAVETIDTVELIVLEGEKKPIVSAVPVQNKSIIQLIIDTFAALITDFLVFLFHI